MDFGHGWSAPEPRRLPQANPMLLNALHAAHAARRGGGGGGRVTQAPSDEPSLGEAIDAAKTPGVLGPGDFGPDSDASESDLEQAAMQPRSFMVGGRPYQYDPRLALAQELAKQRAIRGVDNDATQQQQQNTQQNQRAAQQDRIERLIQAGYSPKEATRQVLGGARTVDEETQLINARGQVQLTQHQAIQKEIDARASQAQDARANLAAALERSKSGDRQASLDLRKNQILLADATRAHAAALKAQQANMGVPDMGDPTMDPGDAALNAAVDQRLDDVQSTEAARQGAIAGVRKAGNTGAAGAADISDRDAAAFLGVRQPAALDDASGGSVQADPMAKYHAAFQKGTLPGQTGPGQGLAPSGKALAPDQHSNAASDPAYKAWLESKGYDVSGVPHPDDAGSAPPEDLDSGTDGGDEASGEGSAADEADQD
jgi:hypothetical protein